MFTADRTLACLVASQWHIGVRRLPFQSQVQAALVALSAGTLRHERAAVSVSVRCLSFAFLLSELAAADAHVIAEPRIPSVTRGATDGATGTASANSANSDPQRSGALAANRSHPQPARPRDRVSSTCDQPHRHALAWGSLRRTGEDFNIKKVELKSSSLSILIIVPARQHWTLGFSDWSPARRGVRMNACANRLAQPQKSTIHSIAIPNTDPNLQQHRRPFDEHAQCTECRAPATPSSTTSSPPASTLSLKILITILQGAIAEGVERNTPTNSRPLEIVLPSVGSSPAAREGGGMAKPDVGCTRCLAPAYTYTA
ncbi:hypothetical protein P280DRAFT_524349 [Massarina eburnea CBS 473.64]|uniref:Uncharacterized protein n=1 Tax=Massarina eburnea CBS 473.64 TaxID=1395130 RepID=A0A6A6RJN2_9PLEO|nr:hypothetical protein P280DRAFT_524349 [Massarina eburnea CBS 473.64]